MTPTEATQTRADDSTKQCYNCGAHVSRGFMRVFGNNENELYGCLECSTARELREGSATTPSPTQVAQPSP